MKTIRQQKTINLLFTKCMYKIKANPYFLNYIVDSHQFKKWCQHCFYYVII